MARGKMALEYRYFGGTDFVVFFIATQDSDPAQLGVFISAKLEYLSSSMVHVLNSGQSSDYHISSPHGLRPDELNGTNDFNNVLL